VDLDAAVDAAAHAVGRVTAARWDDLVMVASTAIEAAAPIIAAQALRDVAESLEWRGTLGAQWLRARADAIATARDAEQLPEETHG
jgi:hypothetical protein